MNCVQIHRVRWQTGKDREEIANKNELLCNKTYIYFHFLIPACISLQAAAAASFFIILKKIWKKEKKKEKTKRKIYIFFCSFFVIILSLAFVFVFVFVFIVIFFCDDCWFWIRIRIKNAKKLLGLLSWNYEHKYLLNAINLYIFSV